MIGIDTNIILRFVTRDHVRQFELARRLIAGASALTPLCVNIVTLTEVMWILESRLQLPANVSRSIAHRFIDSSEVVPGMELLA